MDGIYKIGVDIAQGVWHTDGPRAVRAYGVYVRPQCAWRVGFPATQGNVPRMSDSAHNDDSGPADVSLARPSGSNV